MSRLRDELQGGYVEGLQALRDELADSVTATDSAHGKAALARVLLDTLAVLEEHAEPASREGTGLDEFTRALRAKGRPGAAAAG